MTTSYQSGSWSSSTVLAGYGLSATIGPQVPTTADMKRLNSRSGGKFEGVGNWMQSFVPPPIQKSKMPMKLYDYDERYIPIVRQHQTALEGRTWNKKRKFLGSKRGPKPTIFVDKSLIKEAFGTTPAETPVENQPPGMPERAREGTRIDITVPNPVADSNVEDSPRSATIFESPVSETVNGWIRPTVQTSPFNNSTDAIVIDALSNTYAVYSPMQTETVTRGSSPRRATNTYSAMDYDNEMIYD